LKADCDKTARLSLEEINELFGDVVIADRTNTSEEEKQNAAELEEKNVDHLDHRVAG
jgi:hypothetical protein